jgi:Mrp family chromosome partitioning ATPase
VLVEAETPTVPFAPDPWRAAILGLGVGLFAGIGLAFLLEQFDTRLRTTDEIAYALRVPTLGRIPRISRREINENTLVTLTHPDGHAAEAFRMVRTNLEFLNVDDGIRSLVITSCVQGEGKSVAVANLAVSMALAGKKVIVVDGDLRRPRQHQYFGLKNQIGLSTVTTGQTNLAQSLQAVEVAGAGPNSGATDFASWARGADAMQHLYVLTSGPLPPNPGEIVAAKRFTATIERRQREADLVIVDSPAMLPVGDASAIASSVDGLVFLVEMHLVNRPQLAQAADQLRRLPCRLLGTVVRAEGHDGGRYGYYGAYGYGYGEDGGKKKVAARRRPAPAEERAPQPSTPPPLP